MVSQYISVSLGTDSMKYRLCDLNAGCAGLVVYITTSVSGFIKYPIFLNWVKLSGPTSSQFARIYTYFKKQYFYTCFSSISIRVSNIKKKHSPKSYEHNILSNIVRQSLFFFCNFYRLHLLSLLSWILFSYLLNIHLPIHLVHLHPSKT